MSTRARALCRRVGLWGAIWGALSCAVSGCGFHPLYAPSGHIQAGLSEIFVDTIANRNGQLFRQALQERLQGSDADATPHYVLSVSYSVATQGIGVESDNASTRNRFIATAVWTLRKPGLTGQRLTGGVSRTVDGNDTIAAQFFYSELNAETVNRRLGEALADQITQALAIYFRAHPALI
jgi:LPS-assembly lipoprotein